MSTARVSRDPSIDRLRGIVMVLMALDHARDFFGDGRRDPTNLATTTPFLFFTRFITHYCAPVFVLLAGTAAFMQLRTSSKREVSRFLLTRGLWLILLEVTVIRVGWFFDLTWRFTALQVIWAIGWSMIVLAALVWLDVRAVAAFGLLTIGLHNLLDRVTLGPPWLQSVLHAHGAFEPITGRRFFVAYPLVPWIGVIAVGFALGPVLLREDRRKRLVQLGVAAIALFVIVRGTNLYGDPRPWTAQASPLYTVFSFLNCQKYPPSLCYVLMTIGPALLALVVLDRRDNRVLRAAEIFGRVPLFYYIAHLYLLHAGAVIAAYLLRGENILGKTFFAGGGVRASLPWVYVAWLVAIALLYPLSRWYAALKSRRRDVWLLRYL
jgi:uncharacterized membrane protein